jgi:hypothetical protein
MDAFIEIARIFGAPAAILAYFAFKDYHNHKNGQKSKAELSERIRQIEDYQRQKLEDMVVKSTEAINNLNDTSKDVAETHNRLCNILQTRPCIARDVNNVRQ